MGKLHNLIKKKNRLIVGLMSGTSADGIDACLVKIDNANPKDPASRGKNLKVKPIGCKTYKFPQEVQQKIIQVSDPSYQNLDEVLRLNMALGEYFAQAVFSMVKASGYEMEEIDLIGSHGQTVRHLPEWEKKIGKKVRATLQIGEPAVIASKTGVVTVGDFRTGDIALGGQGAPLTPYVHYLLFGDKRISRLVVNIGGIANITVLPKAGRQNDIFAFDSGPGNMIVDNLTRKIYKKNFDPDGKIASSGKVNFDLLNRLKEDEYFSKRPPKSCGRENFGEEFVSKILNFGKKSKLKPEYIITTASELSVWSILDAYEKFVKPKIELNQVLLCGGGVHNKYFLNRLKFLFHPIKVMSTQELGQNPDFLEAISFAILANQTIEGKPVSFRKTTGAKKPGVLGKICLP
jgi:anhydro-N-acetylmuramic acid kinase